MVVAWTGIGEAVDDSADAGAVVVEVMFTVGVEREASRSVVRQWPEERVPPHTKAMHSLRRFVQSTGHAPLGRSRFRVRNSIYMTVSYIIHSLPSFLRLPSIKCR